MAGFETPAPNDTGMTAPAAVKTNTAPTGAGDAPAADLRSAHASSNGAAPETKSSTAAPDAPTDEAAAKDEAPSRMDKAEQFVDVLADKIGKFTSYLGRKIVTGTSRLREATQDFWAEVQNVRRGKQE
jgi:hypothetical protein